MSESHQLIQAGVKRLHLLGRHGEALMRGYAGGRLSDEDFSPRGLEQLLAARVLWRSDNGDLRISHRLREFLAEMLQDEQRRQINTDMAGLLEHLRNLVNRYLEAQNRGHYMELEQVQQLLSAAVDDFNSRFADAIDSLWQRLHSDFGFVQGLEEKIRENRRAQQQVKRLLDGLEMIDFDEWITLAGSHGFLRRLLVSQWQQQMSEHYSSLRLVQERLVALIMRFREQQASVQLVRGMAKYLRQKVDHTWQPYAQRSQVPTLLNVASPLPLAAYAQVERVEHQQVLSALVAHLPASHSVVEIPEAKAVPMAPVEEVPLLHSQVKQAAQAFYMHAIEHPGQTFSALAHWQAQAFPWDADIWLFQIYSEHQSIARERRSHFVLTPRETVASDYNELRLIHDYQLTVRL